MKLARVLGTLLLILALLAPSAYAAGDHVRVSQPSFAVKIDGVTLDNRHARYPLLVYRDITYFPMTWNFSQALGLTTHWSQETGLRIDHTGHKEPLQQDLQSAARDPRASYTAAVAAYPIQVNGKAIDNKAEPYPILNFLGITYFPMTWRFAHDEFGWETHWSKDTGFSIITRQDKSFLKIIDDDEEALYVQSVSHDIFKIGKSLADQPVRLTESDRERIEKRAREKWEQNAAPLRWETPQQPYTERRGDAVYFGDTELFSLKPYIEDEQEFYKANPPMNDQVSAAYYTEQAATLGENKVVLALTVHYRNDIPAPYTPSVTFNFVVDRDRIEPLEGSDQIGWNVIASEDGSHWIYSLTPDIITVRNITDKGELVLVGASGKPQVINALLGVPNVEVVAPLAGGLRVVASDRASLDILPGPPDGDTSAYGIYDVYADGTVEKISDLYGYAYVDSAGNTYVVDPNVNRITEIGSMRSGFWPDHELRDESPASHEMKEVPAGEGRGYYD